MTELTIQELLPKGQALMSNGEIWQRMKWDGPNYEHRTPVEHGVKDWLYDLHPPKQRSEKVE